MKTLFTILFIVVSLAGYSQVALPTFQAVQKTVTATPPIACGGTKTRVFPGGDGGKTIDGSTLSPGDTIMLNASSSWTYFAVYDVQGTASCPVVIMSSSNDTAVTIQPASGNGIQIFGTSSYVKITGRRTGDTDTSITASPTDNYGIYITPTTTNTTVAVGISDFARCIEVDRVKAYKTTYTVWAKNETNCDTSYNYNGSWSFFMDSINIHHTYSKNIGQDVMYLGSTGQLPTDRPITCDGVTKYYIPMRLSNILAHHNYIDSANRTGIQLGGGMLGINKIYANTVMNVGYEYNQQQGNGIAIGGMTRNCYVFDNNIKNTFLYGVLDFGADSSHVFNNIIDSSGIIRWNDPYMDLDSFATANSMTVRGGQYLVNSVSGPSNIIASTKQTDPSYTKTVFYTNNELGYNAYTADSLGNIVFANFSSYPQDWTANNVVCGNVRIIDAAAATITRYTYLSQDWPTYSSDCGAYPPPPEPMPMARARMDNMFTRVSLSEQKTKAF